MVFQFSPVENNYSKPSQKARKTVAILDTLKVGLFPRKKTDVGFRLRCLSGLVFFTLLVGLFVCSFYGVGRVWKSEDSLQWSVFSSMGIQGSNTSHYACGKPLPAKPLTRT